MQPFKTGGVYLNFMPDEGESRLGPDGGDRVVGGYGREKYARLVALKTKYDAANMFRCNFNIPPTGRSTGPNGGQSDVNEVAAPIAI